jgi:hypothetical protein
LFWHKVETYIFKQKVYFSVRGVRKSWQLMLSLKWFCGVVESRRGPLHPWLHMLTAGLASDKYYGVRIYSLLSSLFSHLRMKKRNVIPFKCGCHVQTSHKLYF